ncbi:hypothetical protein GCK32_011307 [Trichostrongylus colubriformis]|uniref:Retrotransposon gag domain-containing protein n=1 Tax=Trichostrongylus colubriformis TaxID=6319 RepID=A0AAN8F497_TRICO
MAIRRRSSGRPQREGAVATTTRSRSNKDKKPSHPRSRSNDDGNRKNNDNDSKIGMEEKKGGNIGTSTRVVGVREVSPAEQDPATAYDVYRGTGGGNCELLESLFRGKEAEQVTLKEWSDTMAGHFQPRKLILAERFGLMSRSQRLGQTLQDYYAELQKAPTT